MTKPTRILWVGDPWESLDHQSDTTVRLVSESCKRNNQNYWSELPSIIATGTSGTVICRQASLSGSLIPILTSCTVSDLSLFNAVIFRADPPVTETYIHAVKLISNAIWSSGRDPETYVLNPPSVILTLNSKLLPLLTTYTAHSIVAFNPETLIEFVRNERIAVLKTLDHSYGSGVRLVRWKEGLAQVAEIINEMTRGGSTCIVAQKYIPNHRQIEKRAWFVDGKLLAVCKKIYQPGKFPPQLAKNKYIRKAILSVQEKRACLALGKILQKMNVRIAGVDLIGSLITDVNVISPGLLIEMEVATGRNLAVEVLKVIEATGLDP